MRLFIIGSALRGVCGDQTALGLRYLCTTRTAPRYRLFAINDAYATLVKVDKQGQSFDGEICEIDAQRGSQLLAAEPDGIEIQPVFLADGGTILAATSTLQSLPGDAVDISDFGSFLNYLNSRSH